VAVFAVILWIADQRPTRRHIDSLKIRDAVIIGTAQAAALAPGVSRSGITISAARFMGLDRDAAARVSVLPLVPVTLGAVLFKGTTDVLFGDLPVGWEGPSVVGVLAAAASGLVAIVFLLGFVRRHTYTPFVVYRLIVAALCCSSFRPVSGRPLSSGGPTVRFPQRALTRRGWLRVG
jgi:undecaprenyl-diphosphatase